METSTPDQGCQRPRNRCEPGQTTRLKILPKLWPENASRRE